MHLLQNIAIKMDLQWFCTENYNSSKFDNALEQIKCHTVVHHHYNLVHCYWHGVFVLI